MSNRTLPQNRIRATLAKLNGHKPAPALSPLLVGLYSPAGELVRTIEIPDPRNRFCETFDAIGATDLTARPVS